MRTQNGRASARAWLTAAALSTLFSLSAVAERAVLRESEQTGGTEGRSDDQELDETEEKSEPSRSEGVRQKREEERTVVTRTTEERVLPRAELKDDESRPEGHFALQMHAGCVMEVMFKEIEIRE